jgi:hypothetical protein
VPRHFFKTEPNKFGESQKMHRHFLKTLFPAFVMKPELEAILKEAGAIKLKVTQNFVTSPRACTVSDVYSKSFPEKAVIIDASLLYLLININSDKTCKYNEILVNKCLPFTEGTVVYVVQEGKLSQLQKFIPELKKYF